MMVDLDSTNSIANGDYYYGHDHLYSPAVLFYEDGTGAEIVERYEYDAYGKTTILSPAYSVLSFSQYGNPYTFTGRRLDVFDYNSTTSDYDYEIMYYRARYYDTDTGRFTQRDPLGITPNAGKINPFKQDNQYTNGMNVYNYVESMPIVLIDPHGLSYYPIFPPITPPSPSVPSIFAICKRKMRCFPYLNQHAYIFSGDYLFDEDGFKWGWGFSRNGTCCDKFFNPTVCKTCKVKSKGTLESGKSCEDATESDIRDCIQAHVPSKKYVPWIYDCYDYAKEAAKACCLKCSGGWHRSTKSKAYE